MLFRSLLPIVQPTDGAVPWEILMKGQAGAPQEGGPRGKKIRWLICRRALDSCSVFLGLDLVLMLHGNELDDEDMCGT